MQPLTSARSPLVFEDAKLDEHLSAIEGDKPTAHFRLHALDEILGGVHPGQITAFAAEPGSGKTTLAGQVADDLAEQGHPVIFVSAELAPHKILEKSLVRCSCRNMCLSNVSQEGMGGAAGAFAEAVARYRECIAPNMCIIGTRTPAELCQLVSACINERGEAPTMFIDYLQHYATSCAEAFADERLAIASCVRQLRDMANTYAVPVLVLSAITRSAYATKKPNLSIFGGSALIEYSFDTALYLHGDDERQAAPGCTALRLEALKNRYAAKGYTELDFDPAHATFCDCA